MPPNVMKGSLTPCGGAKSLSNRRNLVCNSYNLDQFEVEGGCGFSPRRNAPVCHILRRGHLRHALRAMAGLRGKFGLRVPEELSVVGYANLDMADYCDPPLTTVAEPFEEVGRDRLLHAVGGDRPRAEIVVFGGAVPPIAGGAGREEINRQTRERP